MRLIESFPPLPAGQPMQGMVVAAGHPSALFHLQRPGVVLALWHRPLPGNLVEAGPAAELAALAATDFDLHLEVEAATAAEAVAAALPVPAPLHFQLDMMTLVGLFGALARVSQVVLRLASHPVPDWAGSAPGHRLMTSYAAPGLTGLPGSEAALPPGSVAALPGGAPVAGSLLLCLHAP